MLFAAVLMPFKIKHRTKGIALILITVAFMAFWQFSASVNRSGIMLILALIFAMFDGDRIFTVNGIGAAVLVILIISPLSALDIGLQLSVAGTFGIGVFGRAACSALRLKLNRKYFEEMSPLPNEFAVFTEFDRNTKFIETISASPKSSHLLGDLASEYGSADTCAAFFWRKFERYPELSDEKLSQRILFALVSMVCVNIAILPISGLYFGGYSLGGGILTLFTAPLFTVMVLGGLTFTLLGCVGGVGIILAEKSAELFLYIIRISADITGIYVPLDYAFFKPFVFAAIAICVAAYLIKNIKWCFISACVSCIILSVVVLVARTDEAKQIQISQTGNFILITHNNSAAVIFTNDHKNDNIDAEELLNERGFSAVSLSAVLKYKYNNAENYAKFPTVFNTDGGAYQFDGFVVYLYDGYAVIEYDGNTINFPE
jgi:hypothetical protein